MKMMKRIQALLLAVVLCVTLFAACGEAEPTNADYRVTVVDAGGTPITSGYAVKFMQNGQQVAMQIPDANGQSVKNMVKGDYVVELQFSGSETYHIAQEDMTLSADKTDLTVVLAYAMPSEGRELFAGDQNVTAYGVKTGCTYVQLSPDTRNYFLFTPTEAGLYEFSVLDSQAAIGYYGAPHFVQDLSAAEVVDNKFTMSIRASSIGAADTGTMVMVIGLDAGQETSATLSIQRLGDPEWTVEDEEWTIYRPTVELSEFSLPEGAELVDFDLTSTEGYTLVLNETDGFYHLNTADGPLVLVRLGRNADTPYIDPLGRIIETANVSSYFYDEEGNFLKKETYVDCLYAYCAGNDPDGDGVVSSYVDQVTGETVPAYYYLDKATETYPLTEDLKYIIQSRGEYAQWWVPGSSGYLFKDSNENPIPGINHDIAWLFMCCYIG